MRRWPQKRAIVLCLVVGVLLAALPCVFFRGFFKPIPEDQWYTWKVPLHLKAEMAVFDVLVVPPSLAFELLGSWRTIYCSFALPHSPRSSIEGLPGVGFSGAARGHLVRAVPFWSAVLLVWYGGIYVLRKRRERAA